jgi:hypothetical protein
MFASSVERERPSRSAAPDGPNTRPPLARSGLDISGGTLEPDHSDNNDLYGRKITAREIVIGKSVSAPKDAAEFMTPLKQTVPGA